jgi:hypothetical protein
MQKTINIKEQVQKLIQTQIKRLFPKEKDFYSLDNAKRK